MRSAMRRLCTPSRLRRIVEYSDEYEERAKVYTDHRHCQSRSKMLRDPFSNLRSRRKPNQALMRVSGCCLEGINIQKMSRRLHAHLMSNVPSDFVSLHPSRALVHPFRSLLLKFALFQPAPPETNLSFSHNSTSFISLCQCRSSSLSSSTNLVTRIFM